jgi:hypothetical protein
MLAIQLRDQLHGNLINPADATQTSGSINARKPVDSRTAKAGRKMLVTQLGEQWLGNMINPADATQTPK